MGICEMHRNITISWNQVRKGWISMDIVSSTEENSAQECIENEQRGHWYKEQKVASRSGDSLVHVEVCKLSLMFIDSF